MVSIQRILNEQLGLIWTHYLEESVNEQVLFAFTQYCYWNP